MDDSVGLLILLWCGVGGLIGALIGSTRGRTVDGCVLGALIGFIGWILILAGPDERIKCPHCLGAIPEAATKCKHCGSPLC